VDQRTAPKAQATKRVLIVDDEQSVLSVMRASFASFRHGHAYQIMTAESAADAFTLLRQEQFSLILLDIAIPAASGRWLRERSLGLGLLARFRALGVSAPVLLITGSASDAMKEAEALKLGAAGFLYKPIGVRQLDDVVARVLASGA
jgi:DNA-binding NtrC family response regulator